MPTTTTCAAKRTVAKTTGYTARAQLSAGPDEPGVIPGSMGTASFHVLGPRGSAIAHSSSHGAGRQMSRSEACAKNSGAAARARYGRRLVRPSPAGLLRDEAPAAYKDIHAVMRGRRDLTRIVRQLRPVLSYKGV